MTRQAPTLAELLAAHGGEVRRPARLTPHDESETAHPPVALTDAWRRGGLSFCDADSDAAAAAVLASSAQVILVSADLAAALESRPPKGILLISQQPRLDFVHLVNHFWPEVPEDEFVPQDDAVAISASVHPSAFVANGVSIGPHCVVGPDCALFGGVRLYRGVTIGRGVRIDANAVIGSPGYGFVRGPNGWQRFPQRGNVVIEDDVELGANVCVDRGALGETRIGHGTKVDNLTYIAHNVIIGQRCLVMASCTIAGSVRIEDDVQISPGATVRDYCRIGRAAHVGLGAVVVSDVAAATTVAGVPAKVIIPTSNQDPI